MLDDVVLVWGDVGFKVDVYVIYWRFIIKIIRGFWRGFDDCFFFSDCFFCLRYVDELFFIKWNKR